MTHIVAGKSSNDNWDVEGTPAGVPLTINLGPGDVVNLGKSQSLSNIGGNVTINGGSGNGTLNVSDGSDTGASRWTINSTAVSWQSVSGVTSSVALNIQFNSLTKLVVNGSTGGNFFDIVSVPASALQMVLNGDDNSSDQAKADEGGASGQIGAIIQVIAAVEAVIDSIFVNGVPNLVGGASDDKFVFLSSVPFQGTIHGGSGNNTLDFSQYKGDVTVDLPLGFASAVTGGISNITTVIGSQGNNVLVGNGIANVLRGGTGRNILIGRGGGATLDASASKDDNILIGGTTQWDLNLAALQAIAQAWFDTTQSFDQRVQALESGIVGPTQTYALNVNTIQGDATVDRSIGGAGRNWFFVDSGDIINNGQGPSSSDLVTNLKPTLS
jgi:hypothetical protein